MTYSGTLIKNRLVPLPADDASLSSGALGVVAAGFEDRSRSGLERFIERGIKRVIVIRYDSEIGENNSTFEWMAQRLNAAGVAWREIPFSRHRLAGVPEEWEHEIGHDHTLTGGDLWIDVSGLPMFGICLLVRICRRVIPSGRLVVFYTEAQTYYPTRSEYEKVKKKIGEESTLMLPPALSSEMSDNLILDVFAGSPMRELPTCLLLQCGFEAHRSHGVVEHINPSKLVVVYGKPERRDLEWRTEMSRTLHKQLQGQRLCAEEEVSTLSVEDNLVLIESYYQMLYEDHNIAIAPVCSKMQALGAYLAWERYRDIQLVFPIPISYLPDRFSSEAGETFCLEIPASLP